MTVAELTHLDPIAARKRAESLWGEVRSAFVNAEEVLRTIIAERAWEPLEYPTFHAAWADRMQGVPLATDACRGAVIYAFLDEGCSDREVADMMHGVGPVMVAQARENRALGVPAWRGLIRRRGTYAEAPSRPYRVTVEVDEPTRAKWVALADAKGVSLAVEAERALRVWFDRVEREAGLSA